MDRSSSHGRAPTRSPRRVPLWVATSLLVTGIAVASARSETVAIAGFGQATGTQVVLNPGGGGFGASNGIRIVVNRDTDGHDALSFDGDSYTSGGADWAPMLNIGGQLYGQAGPGQTASNWTSIFTVSTSGAVQTGGTSSAKGDALATLRYVATVSGLVYVMDRTISYTYPNNFFRETYSFTIPVGNSAPVTFYQGGDMAPGGVDVGVGVMMTGARRSVAEASSGDVVIGFREVAGGRAFDGATAQNPGAVSATVASGGNVGFSATHTAHDAGLMVQWNLGSTPGTQTASMETFVGPRGTDMYTSLTNPPDATVGDTLTYRIELDDSSDFDTSADFTFQLPVGLEFTGTLTTAGACAGSATAPAGSRILTLTSYGPPSGATCRLDVQILAAARGTYDLDINRVGMFMGVFYRWGNVHVQVYAPAVWSDTTLAAMQAGVFFTDSIAATSADPVTYTVVGGSLPAGLTLDGPSGTIAGTPTTAGAYDFTVVANNGASSPPTHQFTGTIAAAPPPPTNPPVTNAPAPETTPPTPTTTAPQTVDRGFLAISPRRLLDTRDGGAPLAAGTVQEIAITGEGIPTDATAAIVNLAVDAPQAGGYLTVFPCGQERPVAANLNYRAGQTASNAATAFIGSGHAVCVYTSAPTHLIVDLSGVYSPSAGTGLLGGVGPLRWFDTRDPGASRIGRLVTVRMSTQGVAGLPADATAIVLNMAVTDPERAGFARAWPCDGVRPTTSSINFARGQTTSNAVVTGITENGRVCLESYAATEMIVDVSAAYSPRFTGGHLLPTTVARLLDSRDGGPVPVAGTVHRVQVAGVHGVPETARLAAFNVAVDQPQRDGFVTVFPCDQPRPTVANLNFAAGETKSNSATVALTDDGDVCVYSSASAHVILDVNAAFGPQA